MGLLRVRHDTSSAAVVRQHLRVDLAARAITEDSAADVLLVATELIGNAIVHSRNAGDLNVGWDVGDTCVVVRVDDGSTVDPRPREVDDDATSGRGLTIVAALSDEWGVNHIADGKQVWARVPVCQTI